MDCNNKRSQSSLSIIIRGAGGERQMMERGGHAGSAPCEVGETRMQPHSVPGDKWRFVDVCGRLQPPARKLRLTKLEAKGPS